MLLKINPKSIVKIERKVKRVFKPILLFIPVNKKKMVIKA